MSTLTPDFSQSARLDAPQPPKEMLTVARDGAQTLVKINASSLNIIQTCPRKAQYELHDRWVAKAGSPALIDGQAKHKALEVFYKHPKSERNFPRDFYDVAPLIAHGYAPPEPHFLYDALKAFVAIGEPLRNLPDSDKRSLASGIWVLGHYFRTYLHDPYVIYSDDAGPCAERTCEHTLYEDKTLRIVLFGTIDIVLRNEVTGDILAADHKTTSQMGRDFFNRIKPNSQYTGYVWLAQKCLGLKTENFMVNGLETKATPKTSRGSPPAFTRQITCRTAEDFVEFTDVVVWAVNSYLKWLRQNRWPLGSVDACAMWGGCTFLDVCSAPNALRKNILDAKYTRATPELNA